ncbi:MAG: transcription termination/antitermination protein NusG [Oscillospiraceae bacterium]|nr:transcription termination/antitermination protein NusG [Oscillospiraceae bacterium]
MADKAKWYVVHTYSGYEDKVKANLEKIIENRNMQDVIVDIRVPKEEVTEKKDDKVRTVMRKTFPGYVVIKMEMTDVSWFVVRNCRGVTGFVGPGAKPVPLTSAEIDNMGIERKVVVLDYEVGDNIRVRYGAFEGFFGVIEEINTEKNKVSTKISMFGRDTTIDLECDQVEVVK